MQRHRLKGVEQSIVDTERQLAALEQSIADTEMQLTVQRELLDLMIRSGEGAYSETQVLKTFEQELAQLHRNRRRLLQALADAQRS